VSDESMFRSRYSLVRTPFGGLTMRGDDPHQGWVYSYIMPEQRAQVQPKVSTGRIHRAAGPKTA
jgi:hypothetical protein